MADYPRDWPRCPVCGAPALDGHITCGAVECHESEAREKKRREYLDTLKPTGPQGIGPL